jgi:hypothetical protein
MFGKWHLGYDPKFNPIYLFSKEKPFHKTHPIRRDSNRLGSF